ncbi:hypothetical protein BpHYR1_052909 [Brachionus plicatilis]|uniref:Uncharacterized protein n=1 Tax=Brachionus plicatilis TaxID=10195 RepID=A0A3M7QIA6_BRAPC|nr:hypothetical protein BpHYR1_052909 [Brachionus plicatilis]
MVNTVALSQVIDPGAFVFRTIQIEESSLAVFFVLHILANIPTTIFEFICSLAMSFTMLIISFIRVSVWQHCFSVAMSLFLLISFAFIFLLKEFGIKIKNNSIEFVVIMKSVGLFNKDQMEWQSNDKSQVSNRFWTLIWDFIATLNKILICFVFYQKPYERDEYGKAVVSVDPFYFDRKTCHYLYSTKIFMSKYYPGMHINI